MFPTDYLSAPYSSATDYTGSAIQTSWVDPSDAADDAAIGAMFEEDDAVLMGVVPDDQFGAVANGHSQGVAQVKTRLAQAQSMAKKTSGGIPSKTKAAEHARSQQRIGKLKAALDQSRQKRAYVLTNRPVRAGGAVPGAPGLISAGSAFQDFQAARYHGVGDLDFIVNAPPGVGRLERLPFNVLALIQGAPGTVVGDSIVSVPAGTAPNTVNLATDQIPWAVVRIVGVEITRTINNPGAGAPDFWSLDQFNVGGGAELFLQQGVIDLDYFAAGLDRIPGLRDYPIVRSPNQAFITVSWENSAAANAVTTAQDTIIGVDLLVDVLADDNFGAHIPGPYARAGAMVRKPVGRR